MPETAWIAGIPFVISEPSFTNPTTPTVILPLVFPGSSAGPTTVSLPTAVNPDTTIPYSMQYNRTIEHQRGSNAFRVSYVGTNTRHGDYNYNINQPLPSTGLFINQPQLFPAYPAINYLTNGAGHKYNGFTAEVKRRGAKGLTYPFVVCASARYRRSRALSTLPSLAPSARACGWNSERFAAQDFPFRGDKDLVTDFLANAERIFQTAASTNGAELDSGNLAILIGQNGAVHMLMGSDWPLGSLQAHHGARAAYRVSRSSSQVRVEGKSQTGSCLLQSELPSAVAKRLLSDKPHYLVLPGSGSLERISAVVPTTTAIRSQETNGTTRNMNPTFALRYPKATAP